MMGLLKWYLGYHAVKHLMTSAQPQPVNIQLNIQLPADSEEDEPTSPPLRPDPGPFSAGDGIYVRDDGVHPPRFFDPSGRETDKDGSPL